MTKSVSAASGKVEKYTACLEGLRAKVWADGAANRLELASLVGKLQHVAPVVRGGAVVTAECLH